MNSPLLPRHEDGLSRMDSIQNLIKRIHIPTLAFGVILGVLSIQLLVGRPLMSRLSGLQNNVASISDQLMLLTGHRDDVNGSNSLLESLRTQHDLLVDARKSFDEIRTLQAEIQREAVQTSQAVAALREFAGLQQELITRREDVKAASASLNAIVAFQNRVGEVASRTADGMIAADGFDSLQQELIARREDVQAASVSLDAIVAFHNRVGEVADKTGDRVQAINAAEAGFEQALAAIEKLAGVKTQAIASVDKVEDAESSIATLVALRQSIAAQQAELNSAQDTLNQLIAVKSTINTQAQDVATAQSTADDLIALKNQIVDAEPTIAPAKKNLDSLVALETQLVDRTGSLGDAIQNLELMTGLQDEFNVQTGKLEGLRRGLTEIVMMESALTRTLQMLEPIATRVNLRRLDDAEIREVARTILDRRQPTTRMADNKSKDGFEPGRNEVLVPAPAQD